MCRRLGHFQFQSYSFPRKPSHQFKMSHGFYFVFLTALHSSSPLHIGHSLDEQNNWHKLSDGFEKCAHGFYQTPIHIEEHQVEHIVMPAMEFTGYHNFLHPPLTMHNNGHTVKISIGNTKEGGLYLPQSVSGALLSSTYILDSLHFHWGQDNNQGSEHVLNNVRYPMEMHLVHRNKLYNTTKEALQYKDGIVVLGFFFRLRVSDNQKYKPILRKLRNVAEVDSSTLLDRSFTLAALLPNKLDEFFTYEGSLTTPPCSEAVTWFVFPETIPISFRQMELFRSLPIRNNYRLLQPVGQRKIYLRRTDRFIDPNFDSYDQHSISARSFWLH